MLATAPGQRATVLVVFASTGNMPEKIIVGTVKKLPPPAMALSVPASMATKKSNPNCGSTMKNNPFNSDH
jgi:hypothetical protein